MPSSSRLWFSNNVIGEGHLLVHHQHSPCALNRLVHTSRYRPRAPGIVRSNDPQVIFRGEDISYAFEIILFLSYQLATFSQRYPTYSQVFGTGWLSIWLIPHLETWVGLNAWSLTGEVKYAGHWCCVGMDGCRKEALTKSLTIVWIQWVCVEEHVCVRF